MIVAGEVVLERRTKRRKQWKAGGDDLLRPAAH
jgi:hypothetical protein